MSSPVPLPDEPSAKPPEPAWREFARAPLVPVALAASVGLLADRYGGVPLGAELLTAVVALVGWCLTRSTAPRAATGWVLLCTAALASAHHHLHRHSADPDDIGRFTRDAPIAVRVRGVLADEPDRFRPARYDPLLTLQRQASSAGVLEVTAIDGVEGWQPASGRARLKAGSTICTVATRSRSPVACRAPTGRTTPASAITGRSYWTGGSPRNCA